MSAHYLLIKTESVSLRTGRKLSAVMSAERLLAKSFWPLWKRTPHRSHMQPGDRVAVYASGVALAWVYPLQLEGQPEAVLYLQNIQTLSPGVEVKPLLDELSFVREKHKWGVHFMSGVRAISSVDYARLTGAQGVVERAAAGGRA